MIVDYQKARLVEEFTVLLDSVKVLQSVKSEPWVQELEVFSNSLHCDS